MPQVKTFADILGQHQSGEVSCYYSGNVVRKLSISGDNMVVDACDGEPAILIPLATTLTYQPWMLDRGNINFQSDALLDGRCRYPPGQKLKICGEADNIRYDDGTVEAIMPANELVEAAAEQIKKALEAAKAKE